MNKFKTIMLIFSLLISIISEPLLAAGYVSVSNGVNISASPVVRGNNFSINFTLLERNGQSKTFESVAIAILDPSGKFIFDFAMWNNITVAAKGTRTLSVTSSIFTNRPTGTYKAVIRGKFAGSWFDFNAVGSGVTPKAFSVVATPSAPPAPVVPPAPPAPTLNAPTNGQTNVPQANVKFSWSSAGATNYRIVISQNSAFSGFVDANGNSSCSNNTCFTTTTTSPAFSKNMELAGQTYYWKVRANNATGASGWSNNNVGRAFTTAGSIQLPDFKYITPSYAANPNKRGYCYPQCVEFVKINLNLPSGRTYAKEYWTNPHTGYTNYPQGSSKVPKPGDIMVWSGGVNSNMSICKSVNGCGHVAIVKSVNLTTGTLIRVDANWDGKCSVIEHKMSITKNSSGRYTIGGTGSSYLLGWQSKS